MATIFPLSPEINDTFSSEGVTWKWGGSAWEFFSGPGIAGGGDATVAFQPNQPDVSNLNAGALWIDSDEDAVGGLLPATFVRWLSILSASTSSLSGFDNNDLPLLYTPGFEQVYVNGTLLVKDQDYTADDGNTVSFSTPLEQNDAVEILIYESFSIVNTYTKNQSDAKFFAANSSILDRWTKIFSASATVITGSDDNAFTLDYTAGLESLFVNGVLLAPEEYTRTSASVITLDEAVLENDVVDIISPQAFEVANAYTIAQIDAKYNDYSRWTKTFSASATVITGNDDDSNSLDYSAGYEKVYLNGILLINDIDYTTTNENTITLNEAVEINDTINIISFEPFNIADVYTEAEADNKFLTQSSASGIYLEKSIVEDPWTSYTPSFTNLTTGNGTIDFAYKQIGKTIFVRGIFTFGSTSSISGNVEISLPITSKSFTVRNTLGTVYAEDVGAAGYAGGVYWVTTTSVNLRIFNAAGTYVATSGPFSSTVPFTWNTGDHFSVQFVYEAA